MKSLATIYILPLIILFASCDETKKVVDVAGNIHLTGEYSISEIEGAAVEPNTLTISFTALDKSVRGNAGCNSFFGNYTLDLYALSFGDMASTERYCDESIMEKERAYFSALHNTGSYTLQNDILTLYSKTDRSILIKAVKIIKVEN